MRKLTRAVKTKKFGLVLSVLLAGTIAFLILHHTSAYTFPQTPVLDNFNRAGTTAPPSASWTKIGTFGYQLTGDSDTATPNTANPNTFGGDYWNASTFGPDTEVYATVKTTLGSSGHDFLDLYARDTNPGTSSWNGYEIAFINSGSSNVKVYQVHNNAESLLGTLSTTFSAGDSVGAKVTGKGATVTIEVWHKTAAGSWTSVGTVTDSGANRVTVAGTLAAFTQTTTTGTNNPLIDDFGGGSLSPDPPTLISPANNATGVFTSPTFQLSTAEYASNYVNYEIQVCSAPDCSSIVTSICQITFNGCTSTGQTGWSGQDANSGAAYATTSTTGTTATYVYQPAHLTPNTQYYWRAYAIDPGGNNLTSGASAISTFTTNQTPAAPTLVYPGASATGVATLPIFQLNTTDPESDYLQYYIQLYDATACGGSLVDTFDQTSSQTNWQGQDQQTGTAYVGSSSISGSTMARYQYAGAALTAGHLYSWRAKAIDPGGSQTFGSLSGCQDFTVGSTEVQILNNTTIQNGTIIQ